MCTVLQVSRSGYYEWLKKHSNPNPGSKRQKKYEIMRRIEDIFKASRNIYGSPKVHAQLIALGFKISRAQVARYMAEMKLRSKVRRKYKVTTLSDHRKPRSPNHLMQDFAVKKSNEVWLSDITYINTHEGTLYLASVLDLCTRKIVGWSLASRMPAELVVDAFDMALKRQNPPQFLLFHSDQGSQYASDLLRSKAAQHCVILSMSRRGNCWDNAPKESFFALMKRELVYHEVFKTREEAKAKIFEWIECFYNRERIHSSIGYKTPIEKEAELMLAA